VRALRHRPVREHGIEHQAVHAAAFDRIEHIAAIGRVVRFRNVIKAAEHDRHVDARVGLRENRRREAALLRFEQALREFAGFSVEKFRFVRHVAVVVRRKVRRDDGGFDIHDLAAFLVDDGFGRVEPEFHAQDMAVEAAQVAILDPLLNLVAIHERRERAAVDIAVLPDEFTPALAHVIDDFAGLLSHDDPFTS
jgi:hypothetical protein